MFLKRAHAIYLIALATAVCSTAVASAHGSKRLPPLVLTRQQYEDRIQAIWTGQMIAQWTGLRFEHQVASSLAETPLRHLPGYAPIDDDYYYEMVALRAFEKYGVSLTVEQLGQQWLENNAGSWGSSEQALLLLKRGLKAPDTGSPRYNKLWWTIGPQFSSDIYGALNPGRPVDAARMARRLTHVNGYAEGTDGAVFVSGMISLGFVETDPRAIVRGAAELIPSKSPYRQCLDMVISLAEQGRKPEEIFNAVNDRWGIEYPATNNAVLNGGLLAGAVWFGKGDFRQIEDLVFSAADFADTDCNAANAASVVAAMHGMAALPKDAVAELNDRIFGSTMGPLKLTPAVDESISGLAARTAKLGERVLTQLDGAIVKGDRLIIPHQVLQTLPPELFHLSNLMQWWNPEWELDRAGFGGAGGGIEGIRGNTYLDGNVLSLWPRDEVRGAVIRRSARLGAKPKLSFDVGAAKGCAWHLTVFVQNDRVLDRLVEGDTPIGADSNVISWQHITLDLSKFTGEKVNIRLYDLVLVPHRYAGNSYWRDIEVQ